MRIHVVTHEDMDGFLWGVLEGWLNSGACADHEVRVSSDRTLLGPASPDFWETLPRTDAILFCVTSAKSTHAPRAFDTIAKHDLWKHVVHSDYVHNTKLKYPKLAERCGRLLVGKRFKYLRCCKDWDHAEWLPRTGIQQRTLRYAPPLPWLQWKDLPVVGVYHTFKAAQKHRLPWLKAAAETLQGGVLGSVATRPLLEQQPLLQRVYGTRHSSDYLEQASRARIGLYLMGGTALGHQFWEYAALGCAIVAQHASTHPLTEEDTQEWEHFSEARGESLVEGEDFVYFKTEDELRSVLAELHHDPERCALMAKRVRRKTQPFCSIARSLHVLRALQGVSR